MHVVGMIKSCSEKSPKKIPSSIQYTNNVKACNTAKSTIVLFCLKCLQYWRKTLKHGNPDLQKFIFNDGITIEYYENIKTHAKILKHGITVN